MTKSEIEKVVNEYSQNKETKKLERVACYVRVSTQEQKLHGISLDAQRDKLTEYAKTHNLKISEWYVDEGISGRKMIKNRPALQRMIKDAQAGKFDRIIFIKLDRFFRSVAEYHECMKKIDPILWTATEEKYDLTTANGRAFVNMKITIAELEADQTSERINLVNEYKIKTGQPLTGSQCQGLGFTVGRDSNTGLKNVIKDPETKDLVNDIINYYLTHQNKAQTCRYIKGKYNIDMRINSLNNILTDTKLYGFYKGNPNYCEPYIDKATFDELQYFCNRNIKSPPSKRVYLFSGLVKCPECGRSLTHSCNRNKFPIISLRCNNHTMYKKCDFNKRPNESKLEALLVNELNNHITEYIKSVRVSDNRSNSDNELVNNRIKEIKREMTNSVKSFNKGRMSEADHDREYEALESELKELESQLAPMEERDLTIYEDLLKSNWRDLYEALNKENRRAFWHKYIKEIKLNPDGTFSKVIFF